jgi:hypothetical protein
MPDREQPQPPARYRHVEVLTVNLALWLIIAAYGVIISWVLLAWRVIRARPRRLEEDNLDEKAPQVSGVIPARLDEEPDLAPPPTTSPASTEVAELERLWRLPVHRATPRGH